jgi:hypothetical protein
MRSLPILLALVACDPATPIPTPTGTPEPTPVPTPEPGTELPPELLDCDAFEADLALTDDPDRPIDYLVDCTATVGGTLSIGPGTVVAFEENTGLRVTGGRLAIEGSADAPVVLQGTVETPGHWRGLFLDNDGATDPSNVIAFAEIRHAGRGSFNSNGDVGAIIVWSDNQLTLTDSVVAQSAGVGLNLNYGGSTLTFARNRFEDNGSDGIYGRPEYVGALDSATTFSGNDGAAVGVFGGALAGPTVWQALSAPLYVYPDATIDADDGLTIEAGFEALFDDGAGLSVTGTGPLLIDGTAADPVVLQGSTATPGHWRGLFIDNDDDPVVENVVRYAEIRHAGGGSFNSNGDLGGIILWSGNDLTLEDTTVADSGDVGLNLYYGDSTLSFARNTFTGNTSHAVYGRPEYVGMLDGASTFTGNGGDHVAVFGGSVGAANVWTALGVPVRVLEDGVVSVGEGLTVEAGAVVQFETNAGLSVGGALPLLVQGTATEPIVFEGTTAARGHWRGVLIDGDEPTTVHTLEHLTLRDAGGGAFNSNGDLGGLIVWADQQVTLRDVTISGCAEVGLNATYTGSTLVLDGVNTLTDNALPAWIEPNLMSAFRTGDVYSGNDQDHILVTEGGVDGTHVWQPLDVPYLVRSVTEIFYNVSFGDTSNLTIQPGVEVAFDTQTGLSSTGTFNALGTATDPIVLRGVLPVAGHWKGLYFEDPDDLSAVFTLDHVQISDAGGAAFNSNGDLAGVIAWADTSLTATNVAFTNLAAQCAVNTRYADVTDTYDLAGSTVDASATLSCDPTALP